MRVEGAGTGMGVPNPYPNPAGAIRTQDVLSDISDVSPVGFAEGVRVIFLRTENGLYTIDLNSGNGQMVHWDGIEKIMPYCLYTGA